MTTIEFEKTDGTYTLKDAIILPDDHGLTDAEIEEIKQQRFDDWLAVVTAPSIQYQLDADGNYVLDENGNPIEVIA